jgi:hypothetical protein
LSNVDLRGANLRRANLTNAAWKGVDLTGTLLSGATLIRADLTGARLGGADLAGADLTGAALLGADLRGATLRGATLRRCKLVGVTVASNGGAPADAFEGCDTFGAALTAPEAFQPTWTCGSLCLAVAFNAGGDLIASGHADGTVRLWDAETGTALRVLKEHSNSVLSVAFSPDGHTLASGSGDNTVTLWDVRSGNSLRVLKGHSNWVNSVAFSPDGQTLASGSDDNTVTLWDVRSGNSLRVLKGHSNMVRSVAWSPDGQTLASGADSTVTLWNAATGACLAILLQLPEGWVAFTPDGRYKLGGDVAGGFWHAVHLCRFEPGELDPFVPGLRLPNDAPIRGVRSMHASPRSSQTLAVADRKA